MTKEGYWKKEPKNTVRWQLNKDEESFESLSGEDCSAIPLIREGLEALLCQMADFQKRHQERLDLVKENPNYLFDIAGVFVEDHQIGLTTYQHQDLWNLFNKMGEFLALYGQKRIDIVWKSNEIVYTFEPEQPEQVDSDVLL